MHRFRLCYRALNPSGCVLTPHMVMSTLCGAGRSCSLHYKACHAPLQAAPNFKDVLQQLLPAEQDPKTTPSKADTIPQTPKDSSEKQDAKQPQRGSSTAKATTPKRQDQVTTKAAGSRSADKGRQERERAHGGRHDSIRHHQQVRPCRMSLQCVSVMPVCLTPSQNTLVDTQDCQSKLHNSPWVFVLIFWMWDSACHQLACMSEDGWLTEDMSCSGASVRCQNRPFRGSLNSAWWQQIPRQGQTRP